MVLLFFVFIFMVIILHYNLLHVHMFHGDFSRCIYIYATHTYILLAYDGHFLLIYLVCQYNTLIFQAGGMDLASKLPKIGEQTHERTFGYVFGVSGPGQ